MEDFDPMVLHAAFEKTISDLKDMAVSMQRRVERVEQQCKEEEKQHWQKVAELQKQNQVTGESWVLDTYGMHCTHNY